MANDFRLLVAGEALLPWGLEAGHEVTQPREGKSGRPLHLRWSQPEAREPAHGQEAGITAGRHPRSLPGQRRLLQGDDERLAPRRDVEGHAT